MIFHLRIGVQHLHLRKKGDFILYHAAVVREDRVVICPYCRSGFGSPQGSFRYLPNLDKFLVVRNDYGVLVDNEYPVGGRVYDRVYERMLEVVIAKAGKFSCQLDAFIHNLIKDI